MRVIVIGSGLMGLSTAYFLMRKGIEVTVVDRAAGPARETSFANGSLLTSSMADPWNAPGAFGQLVRSIGRSDSPLLLRLSAVPSMLGWGMQFLRESNPQRYDCNTLKNVRLALYSHGVLKEMQREVDVSCDYSPSGALRAFRDTGALQNAIRRAQWLQPHGIPSEVLDPQEMVALEPALADIREHLVGGIHYPNDAVGNARTYCEKLATALRNGGAEVSYNTPVAGLKQQGAKIEAAITANGPLSADAFVLAAAHAGRALAQSVGFDLPIRPVKGYSITLSRDTLQNGPRMPVIDDTLHAAVVPVGRILRVAGTAEFAGVNLDIPPARIDNLRRLLSDIFPSAQGGEDVSPWTGLRPVSADGVPILSGTPIENLYVNTGHGHLGWTLAAGSGKAVADLITGRTPAINMADYALDRRTEPTH